MITSVDLCSAATCKARCCFLHAVLRVMYMFALVLISHIVCGKQRINSIVYHCRRLRQCHTFSAMLSNCAKPAEPCASSRVRWSHSTSACSGALALTMSLQETQQMVGRANRRKCVALLASQLALTTDRVSLYVGSPVSECLTVKAAMRILHLAARLIVSPNSVYSARLRDPTHAHSSRPVVTPTAARSPTSCTNENPCMS